MQYEIDRLDYIILTVFRDDEVVLNTPTTGLTIAEVLEYLKEIGNLKSRKTIYSHMNRMVENHHLAKGVVSNKAVTYFITDKGIKVLKGDLL